MTQADLARRYAENARSGILSIFDKDSDRMDVFLRNFDGLMFDLSKTLIDREALSALLEWAEDAGVPARRDAMFAGEAINSTEARAALHTAFRRADDAVVRVGGADVMPDLRRIRTAMAAFCNAVRNGQATGATGKPFTDVVNIGIGGSDLGPAMAVQALTAFHDGPRCHFVSNVDPDHLSDALRGLDPETTLVIVVSKTFTTQETLANARAAKSWLEGKLGSRAGQNMAAVSSATERTGAFGIDSARVFGFEDWVGGRYSVWGPVGLSLMLAIGPDRFVDFLAGGAAMDRHFEAAPLAENLPVLLALTGLWHSVCGGLPSRAVIPYAQRLARLPAYLQQLEMESNGKSVRADGTATPLPTGPIVWGEPGTNGQHAFFQLLHQGTHTVPCEFIVAAWPEDGGDADRHAMLVANCLAQSRALMTGRSAAAAHAQMFASGMGKGEADRLAPHRAFPGNRPSTTLMIPQLTPYTLGQIIALYEHRVFVEGVMLGINSFDQWGVELGKEMANALLEPVRTRTAPNDTDPSTAALIRRLAE